MKPLLICFLALTLTSCISCTKSGIASNIPDCIRKEIVSYKNDRNSSIGKVSEYIFQGKKVYAFEADYRIIADAGTIIRDDECRIICGIGGYTVPGGGRLCNGEVFTDVAVFKRVIWEKKY